MTDVADRVRAAYGVQLVAVEPVTSGTDVAVWRGVAADGTAYAVKESERGVAVAAHLAAYVARGVPRPVGPAADGLALLPWVDGPRATDAGMTPARWHALGALLAAVHAAPPLDLPRHADDHDAYVRVLRAAEARLGANAALAGVWDRDAADALVARADALRERLGAAPYVLCHGDAWAGNVVLHGDDVWLLDWDDALLAPRERDLALLLSGVEEWGPGLDRDAFLDGYGTRDLDATRLAYHLCARALDDLGSWANDALAGDDRALRIVRGLLAPGGAVSRALASRP